MTRTEEGYAWWKDDPKTVAAARIQAKGVIGRRELRRVLVESWALPTLRFLDRMTRRR